MSLSHQLCANYDEIDLIINSNIYTPNVEVMSRGHIIASIIFIVGYAIVYTIVFSYFIAVANGQPLTYQDTLICFAALSISAIITFNISGYLLYSQIQLANLNSLQSPTTLPYTKL